MSIWKLDLPASLPAAESELLFLEHQIKSTQKTLDEIPERIGRAGYQASKAAAGELSFQFQQIPAPEAELFDLLGGMIPPLTGVSFGISGKSRLDWEKVSREFEISLNRIKMMLTKFALVETSIQGKVIGRTVVGWSGKTETSWHPASETEQFHIHKRSLQVALASRYLLLNMLLVSAQSAAKLSTFLAVPGGAIMALPAVWKYISQILKDLEKYQNLTRQGVH